MIEDIEFLVIDLFCGAGGTTTGFVNAKIDNKPIALVMACVNHDAKAIQSHWMNHPEVEHYEEDITTMYGCVKHGVFFKSPEMVKLERHVEVYRACYPNAKVILWASLECTNFSKAKGGQPRDADSRTLAEHLDRYIVSLNPDYIQIENVVEFMSWGPLDEKGKPISRKSGADWIRWCIEIKKLGYYDQWKEINSADFGAYTSRNRLFGCFAKHHLPIVWPEPTHSKKPLSQGFFGKPLHKWMPVKDVLDLTDEGISIFNRKKPLVDASLERIEAGLIKFVAGGKDAFLMQYNSGSVENRVIDLEGPCNTIPTENRFALANTFLMKYNSMAVNGDKKHCVASVDVPAPTVSCQVRMNACFITKSFSGRPEGKVIPVTGPAGTITTADGQAIIQAQPFIMDTNFKNVGNSIDEPAKTLLASRHYPYVINPKFLSSYYGNGDNIRSISEPCPTLPTKDRCSLINPVFIQREYKTATNTSIDEPIGTLLTVPKANLVKSFILNPSHGGHCTGTDVPCVVIVARQDKAPLYLVQYATDKNVSIPVYDDDSGVMIRIKKFMAMYNISDIKMRMLKVAELLPIQGFPRDYQLAGNQTDQKKFIGNSVHPKVPEHWSIAQAKKQIELRLAA